MKNLLLIFTFFLIKTFYTQIETNEKEEEFSLEKTDHIETRIDLDSAYISFINTKKYFLKKVIKEFKTRYGIANVNKKDLYPAIFSEYVEFKNGNFIFVNSSQAILFSPNFEIIKEWFGNLYYHKGKNYFSVIIDQKSDIVYDYGGNSISEGIQLNEYNNEFQYNIQNYVSKNSEIVSVQKKSQNTYNIYALFDLKTKKYLTPFKYKKIEGKGNGFLCSYIDSEINKEQVDYYSEGIVKEKFKYAKIVQGENLVVQNENNLWGLYDKNFNPIIPIENDGFDIQSEQNDYLVFQKKGKSFCFDKSGKSLFLDGFDRISHLYDKNFIIKKGEKFGILDLIGKEIKPFDYDSIFMINSFLFCEKNKVWTILNYSATQIIFDQIDELIINNSTEYLFRKGKLWAFHQIYGEKSDFIYEDIKIENGIKYSKINGKWGISLIDKNLSTNNEFDEVNTIYGTDYHIVTKNNKQGIIQISSKTNGQKIILPIEYDFIGVETKDSFSEKVVYAVDRKTGTTKITKLTRAY